MKKIILPKSPGLMNISEWNVLLDKRLYNFEEIDINTFGYSIHKYSEWNFDAVILCAPYSLSPEECLLVKVLAKKLAPLLDVCRMKNIKVVALGRGALIVWEWMLYGKWKSWKSTEPWKGADPFLNCDVFLKTQSTTLPCARLGEDLIIPIEEDFLHWDTFVKFREAIVGWKVDHFYISLLNLFSYMNKSQRDTYGYVEETDSFPWGSDVLKKILEET